MKTYRVTYEGYIEGNYESEDSAIEDLLEELTNLTHNDHNILIETFNEETEVWE